ncbi:MAG: c-type cytochrome domain-containing protein [Bacteroidota bacterium]
MQFGNLHPLILHLPIGILALAFLMELFYRKKPAPKDNGAILFALGISVVSSVFAAISGWLLSENGGYEEDLLAKHKWIAIAFTVGTVLLFFLKKSTKQWAVKSYFPSFLLVLLLLTLTGHYGGSLTHGEDFLFKKAYQEVVIEDIDEALVFNDIVQPILDQKCVSCHNQGKAKGDLLLTSQKDLLLGGTSGSLLDSLETEQKSLLMHRIHMPLEDEEHMPPKGKVQLTSEEIMLLEWWMKNQHCFDCTVKNLPTDKRLEPILAALEKDTSPRALIAEEVDPIPEDYLLGLNQQNISAQKVSEDSPLLSINFKQRKDLSSQDFELLQEYKENIVELNLAFTNFNDTLVTELKAFENLTKLQLQHTRVSNAVTEYLGELTYLESLNLIGNPIDDNGLATLEGLQHLKKLYVWQTEVTETGIAQLQSKSELVSVQEQIADSIFAASALTPPVILAENEVFQDSLKVSLEQHFEGAKLFYVLHDSRKDTIPKVYSEPFYITESTQVTSYATHQAWEPSESAKADFLRSHVEVESVALAQPPHQKYAAQGGKTLMDLKRGTTNFVDGQWLGYEGRHVTATIEFKEKTEVSRISVGSLSIPNSWIFFPVGYTVWGSTDGTNFNQLKRIKLPKPEPSIAVEKQVYAIDFEPTQLKKVRVLVESPLKNPEWHAEPGGNSFIFLDEIVFD